MSKTAENYRVRRVEGNISTDDIIPARYKHMYTEPAQLAPHLFENRFPGFRETLSINDVLVCDQIFGIGSSREQAVTTLLACGVKYVFSPSFGRIFFRNSWNLGLHAIEVDTSELADLSEIKIDLTGGVIYTENNQINFFPPSGQMTAIVSAGGIIPYTINKIMEKKGDILRGYSNEK